MRSRTVLLGRALRSQLFADAIVVKSCGGNAAESDPVLKDHLAKAKRLSAALSHQRASRKRGATGDVSASTEPAVSVFGEATMKAPLMDVVDSVGRSTMLVQLQPLTVHLWQAESRAPSHAGRPSLRRASAGKTDPTQADNVVPGSDVTDHASAREQDVAHDGVDDVYEGGYEDEDVMTVAQILDATNHLWRDSTPAERLHWVLATPLGRRLAQEQFNAASSALEESPLPQSSSSTAVADMMSRYDGLGLRARAGCSARRWSWQGTPIRGMGAAFSAQTTSLEGLYPSRNSSGTSARHDHYATLRRLFADRLVDRPKPGVGLAGAAMQGSCLRNPALAGCTAPGPNTRFVAHKVRAAFSNQSKSLWKQQVKKMIGGEGASTFMGAVKTLQLPSSEFIHTHTDQPHAARSTTSAATSTTAASEMLSDTTAPSARVGGGGGGGSRFSQVLSASEKAAGVVSGADAGTASSSASSSVSTDTPLYFTEPFLALCAEMGIGSPRYAYVSRALLRDGHPNPFASGNSVDEVTAPASTSRVVAASGPWNLEAVRAKAEALSREYDAHVAKLQEGREPHEAAEARRRYDAALLEEELSAVHNRLLDFRMQMPMLRRLADALSN